MIEEVKYILANQIVLGLSALTNFYLTKVKDLSYDSALLRTIVTMIEEYMSQNPLSDDDIKEIKAALEQIPVAKKALFDAARAGVDTKEAEAKLKENETNLRNLLTVYGNGR